MNEHLIAFFIVSGIPAVIGLAVWLFPKSGIVGLVIIGAIITTAIYGLAVYQLYIIYHQSIGNGKAN